MKKIRDKFMNLPIRTALTIMLFPFFLFLIFCCFVFYFSGIHHYSGLVKENAQTIVHQSRDSLNREIENIQEMAEGILSARAFYNMDYNLENGNNPITPVEYLQLDTSVTHFVRHYSVYMDFGGIYLSDNSIYYWLSNQESDDSGMLRNVDYTQYLSENTLEWIQLDELLPEEMSEGKTCHFAIIKTVGDEESKVSGFGIMGIRDDVFLNQIQNSRLTFSSSMAFIRRDGEIITPDSENNTLDNLTESDRKNIEVKMKEVRGEEVLSFETGDYYVVYTPIVIKDIGILAVIPTKELYMSLNDFTHIFLFTILAAVFIFIVLYFVIPNYFSTPVMKLLGQMRQINGPNDAGMIGVDGYREINQIGTGINEMIGRIHALTESIQHEMTAKQATQLQYLFAQINPHFLYNTLDCIRELCVCRENEKAAEMIDQLAAFYRIGVSKGKSYITIEDELRHITSYLSILQTRFEDFQFRVEVPEELKYCYTLRMILQPIVENAVYHGIRPYKTDGIVEIIVRKEEELIAFHVKDDGGGIAEDVLEGICKSLDEPICEYTEKSYGVYGIKNVQDRIQLAYGKQYKIQIETEPDCGTEIIVSIPYKEK